jgi:hypothetical protein
MDSPGLLQLTARPRRLVAAVVAAVAAALLASGSPTIADVAVPAPAPACHSTGWTVSPMTGAVLQESQTSIDGAPCVIKVTTHLPQASVEIVAQPAHGTLTKTGPLSLVYRPAPGFKGTDHYSFHYCGTNDAGESGCATLEYTVTVRLGDAGSTDESATSRPVCHQAGWTESALSNAAFQETQTSINGGSCVIKITTHLPQASVDIITQPGHGTLKQTGPLSLVYQPADGFKGIDHYSFHYCGTDAAGQSGCATLNYTVVAK